MDEETEKLDMKNKPETEVAVFGFGALLAHMAKIEKKLEDLINLGRHTENKIESLMDVEAQERLEKIKRRF